MITTRFKRPARFAVYEEKAAKNATDNSVILGNFNTSQEAEEARVEYGFTSDNYYVAATPK
jgi:hypothetical protein